MAIVSKPNSEPRVSAQVEKKKKRKKSVAGHDEEAEEMKSPETSDLKPKRNRTPGVRVVGGRIYDSENGKTCHQCRQKTMDFSTACKNHVKDKQCTLRYCFTCLLNRYGEKAEEVEPLEGWSCPRCRGICNCSICMKKRGHNPTGMLVQMAKSGGFSSVSDLLHVKGAENVSNYKAANQIGASPRKKLAPKEEHMISSPKMRGKENVFDGKTDLNVVTPPSVLPNVEEKQKKKKPKGLKFKQDGKGVDGASPTDGKADSNAIPPPSVPPNVEEKQKTKKPKGLKVKQDGKGVNGASPTDDKTDSNAVPPPSVPPNVEEKHKKRKPKGLKVMQDGKGVNGASTNDGKTDPSVAPLPSALPNIEDKHNKKKRKGNKVTQDGNVDVNGASPEETSTTLHDKNQKNQTHNAMMLPKTNSHSNKKLKQMKIDGSKEMADDGADTKKASRTKIQDSKGHPKKKEKIDGVQRKKKVLKVGAHKEDEAEKTNNGESDQNAKLCVKTKKCRQAKTDALHLNGESCEAVVPLPGGSELVCIAGVDIPKGDAGSALQFLEFCATFGKILNVKRGQAEVVLRELINGRSTRRGKYSVIIQFQIQLLSLIQEDMGPECTTFDLSHGNDTWLKALKSCIPKSKHLSEAFDSIDKGASGYDLLDSSMKLKLLNYLCDEVLGTGKIRNSIDDQNMKFAEQRKEAKEKLGAAKDKEKCLKKKMQEDVVKAVIAKNGLPLSISEHESIVSEIKKKTAEAHAEMLECKKMVPIDKQRPDAVRIEPIFRDNKEKFYWRLKGYSEKSDILLQDIGNGDDTSESWFQFDAEQTSLIDKHISGIREGIVRAVTPLVTV